MNSMISRIRQITLRDARLVDIGRDISIKVLDARREEKNFIIYLDSTHIENTLEIVNTIEENVEAARQIAPEQTPSFDSITTLIQVYKADIATLKKTFEEDPRALSSLQRQLLDYEDRLKKTVAGNRVQEDSLPGWLSDLNVLSVAATAKLSTEKARLLSDLRETTNAILSVSGAVVTRAQSDLAQHSEEGVSYGFKAQRNTVTIFIITIFLLAYLIIYFPRIVLLPFQRITKTLKAIRDGETHFRIDDLEKSGEFFDLYNSFHNAIYDLQVHNELKTEKIQELQKQLRSFLDEVKEACFLVSGDLRVLYANNSAIQLFSLEEGITGKSLTNISVLWKVLEEPLRVGENERRFEINARLKRADIRKRCIVVLSLRGKADTPANRLIIVK